MSARKLRELPGWEEASVEAAKRVRDDGSTYDLRIGDWLRIIGAFGAPPSVDHVTTELVRGMLLGLQRQWWTKWTKEELAKHQAEKVVDFSQARERLEYVRRCRRRLQGHWSSHHATRDIEELLTLSPAESMAMQLRRRESESEKGERDG